MIVVDVAAVTVAAELNVKIGINHVIAGIIYRVCRIRIHGH